MAPRTLVAQVGSANWVQNERKEVNNREMECLEDFVVTARNEFEWLNEHMAEIFDGTQQIDVIELLKTPGRMRGKTPRTARKILPLDSRQDVNVNAPLTHNGGDVFGASPQKINNDFFKALNDVRKSASPQKALVKSKNENLEADSDVDMQDQEGGEGDVDDGQSTTSSKPPSLVRDSGMWSPSSESGPSQRVSMDQSNQREKSVSPLKSSPTRVEVPSSAEAGYRDFSENTRTSYHSAQEMMPELARQNTNSSVASIRSVPQEMDVKMASPQKSPQKSPKKQSPVKQATGAVVTAATQEPRRSGRLARQSSEQPKIDKDTDVDNAMEPTKTSSSFITADTHTTEDAQDEPMLTAAEATEEEGGHSEGAQMKSPEHTAKLSSEDEPESPNSDSAMSPMQGIVRSSMTFASLPARETLNPKKSIGGSRTSRTSQLENRSSWMGRRTGGKSLGAVSKASDSAKKEIYEEEEDKAFTGKRADDDVVEDDEDDELESKLRLAQLNKSSATQRLNERISQLGKQMPLRHTRSVPPPGFGGLQTATADEDGANSRPPSSRRPTSDPQGQLSRPTTAHGVAAESEEEDWIPARPQMLRAHTAGSTLQSSSEENILEPVPQEPLRSSPRLKNQAPFAVPDRTTSMQTVPSRNVLAQVSPTKLPMPTSMASTSSPTKLPMPIGLASPYPKLPIDEVAPKRPISAMPVLASAQNAAQEPASPAPYKSPFDSAITGLKNRQATLFSKAKQMLFKTAKTEPSKINTPESPKVQHANKLETFASSILRSPTRNQDYSPSPSPKRSFEEESGTPSQPLYPDLNASFKPGPLSPTYNAKANNIYENALKGRPMEAESLLNKSPNKLREELEREREAFRRAEEKAAAERRLEEQRREETRLAEEVARKAQEERAEYEERKAQEERRLQQERQAQEERRLREEQKRKEEDERRRKEREVAKTPMNPRTSEMDLDLDSDEEDLTDVEMVQKNPVPKPQQVKPTPTTVSRIQPPSSASALAQKQSALKKPIRAPPAKEVGGASVKGKQAPVNIRLGTASQREMDQRKVPASTATLVNAMAKSFDPSREETQASQPTPSLSHTSSTSSLKGGKSIASLHLAAKAQKKEQEEAQRKAAQRQEIERRRQENLRREEEKKQAQANRLKKAAEKSQTQEEDPRKKTRLGNDNTRPGFANAKTFPRGLTAANVKKAAEAQNFAAEQVQPELKRQPKRLFQTELDEQEHQKPRQDAILASQPAQVKPQQHQQQLQPPQQQPEAKRRKTEDHQDEIRQQPTYQSGPSGAMRQSNMKKDPAMQTVKPALFSHGYTPAPAHAQHHPPPSSMLKSTLQMVSASKGPQVPGSAGLPQIDAVKFSQDKLKFATPAPSKNAAAAYAAKMSPQYTNGDSIELPDIPSDSEDEDEDNDAFNVPEWAESPELRVALQRQLQVDPEAVFGPMAPLHMEEIFKGKERSHARFRARTSSANWSGQDRLTTAEIEADRIERQRLIENKGWVFRPPQ